MKKLLALCFPLVLSASLAQAQQGVTKDEILIGSIQDLSGPIAGFGKQALRHATGGGRNQ
jgi:branched-chain amino acid transport system substrate-binding protein